MIALFATAEALHQQFSQTAATLLLSVLVFTLLGVVLARRRFWRLRLRWLDATVVLALVSALVYSHVAVYGQFAEAEVSYQDIKLLYVGFNGRQFSVPREHIETVLFGSAGKTTQGCYIKVVLTSGVTYRSATLNEPLDVCKSLRRKMLDTLTIRYVP